MKYIYYKLFILAFFILLEQHINANGFEVDKICYYITSSTDKTVEVTGLSSSSLSVKIPEEVTKDSVTYNVKSIGKFAFYNCTELDSIVIPNGIESIGEYAF